MDIFTVKFFFAEGILGIYNVAQQITTSVEKIYQSFYPILAPVMAKNLVEKDYKVVERQMVMVSRWTLMVQCLLVVIAIFYGVAFMGLIAGDDADKALLVSSGIVLVYLMIGETINGGFGMTDMPILYRYPVFNPVISVIMVPLYVVIAAFFVRWLDFGVEGIAMALCFIYFLMNLIRVITVRRLMGINMLQMSLLKVILAAVGSIVIFELIITLSPIDLLRGAGSAVGIPLLIILYVVSILGYCLTAGDKAKLFAKVTRKQG
jgi:O-antigen/teichoic acid export membrane protein